MEFKHLQSYVEVVRQKSFTKAAEQLFLSQPTISDHVRQLEEELNTKLIQRTTKSIELTAKGQEIYDYAQSILNLRTRMVEACSSQSQKIIHLGASTIPSSYILPEILPEFGELCPDIYFAIHQSDSQGIVDELKEGLFDIGLIGMQVFDDQLECLPFCRDHMVLITPVNEHFLELKQREELPLSELLAEPIIMREKGSGSKKTASLFLSSIGVQEKDLTVVARINDQEAIKRLVAGGLGVSIISEMAARSYLSEKRILGFSLDQYASSRSLYIIWRKNAPRELPVDRFIQFVLKKYR